MTVSLSPRTYRELGFGISVGSFRYPLSEAKGKLSEAKGNTVLCSVLFCAVLYSAMLRCVALCNIARPTPCYPRANLSTPRPETLDSNAFVQKLAKGENGHVFFSVLYDSMISHLGSSGFRNSLQYHTCLSTVKHRV